MNPSYDPGEYLDGWKNADLRAFLRISDRRDFLRSILKKAGLSPAGLHFLDVGCGMGAYMLAAQEIGMSATGFEPSRDHGRIARDALNLDIEVEYFSARKVEGRQFDVILLSHVIEHIYSPRLFIEELLSVLRPGGLLIMVTPNTASLIARLVGGHWPMLLPVDHVTLLSHRSVPHLVPRGCSYSTSTSEYPSEFLATLGSIAKTKLRKAAGNRSNQSSPPSPKALMNISLKSQLLRLALALGSIPFYVAARLTDRAAALRIVVRKN